MIVFDYNHSFSEKHDILQYSAFLYILTPLNYTKHSFCIISCYKYSILSF